MQILAALILPLSVFAFDHASLPLSFREAEGKTFAHQGPNCFATALKLTGVAQSYRGMDEPEFRERVKLQCGRTETPEIGDIGVFEKPGFGFIHAYAYISPEWGMEKPGVDYMGKTPIAIASAAGIQYRYLASPECRRYAKDLGECSNDHYFLRCSPMKLEGSPELSHHQSHVRGIERSLDFLLEQSAVNPEDASFFGDLEHEIQVAARESAALPPGKYSAFLKARIVSLQKQLEFMRPKYHGG